MPDATATIDGQQRDAVYELLIEHLGSLGDVRIAIDRGDFDTARRLAREFTEDFRLLDDIGWGSDGRAVVPLTIAPAELETTVSRLRAEARGALAESEHEREAREADEAARRRYGLVLDTGTEALLEIRAREKARRA